MNHALSRILKWDVLTWLSGNVSYALASTYETVQNYPPLPPRGNSFFGCLHLLCLLEACVIWLFRRRKACLLVCEHLAPPDLTWSFPLVISAAVLMSRAW
jgi:hypothetical protein